MSAVFSEAEIQLVTDISNFYDDPYSYCLYTWPWGVEGTRLAQYDGPDKWQKSVMDYITDEMRKDPNGFQIRDATASGHGCGKGCLAAWLVHWFQATRFKPAGVTTANTQTQLIQKTMRELSIWNSDAINGHWFKWTATRFARVGYENDWYQAAVPNSEHNSQSFAGLHGDQVMVIYDEASTIPRSIFEVTEGAFTTPKNFWILFGNPTENTGPFREVFGKNRKFWNTRHVDSRNAKMATLDPSNMKQFEDWAEQYGEDSDFFKVRVKGEFPEQASTQFISRSVVSRAQGFTAPSQEGLIKIMGVDVARYGDDSSVIARVQGRKLYPMLELKKADTMTTASWVAAEINKFKPDMIVIDGVGVGAGVVDRLIQLSYNIIEVNAGAMPSESHKKTCTNKRAEMWTVMRDWLENADIPEDDTELFDDLTGLTFAHNRVNNKLQLESKEEAKKRGIASPDRADALAHCFAFPYVPKVDEVPEPEPDPGY